MTGRDFVAAAGIAVLVTVAVGFALGLHRAPRDFTSELVDARDELADVEARADRTLDAMNRTRSALARRRSPLAWAANGGL